MDQVKAERDHNHAIVSAWTQKPGAASANGLALASKQHRSWICQLIIDSCTQTVLQTLEAYEEDHKNDGPTMFFSLLMEYSGATRDAIIKAKESLHPSKITLNNFGHDIKAWSQYAHTNLNRITGSVGAITHTHWIHLMSALEESHTERFRLQIIDWNKNWRKQSGEGSNWTILQFLAKADSEYSRLLDLGQWKTQDPNSSIIALQAELQTMRSKFLALQAATTQKQQASGSGAASHPGTASAASNDHRTSDKPTWFPAEGATNLEHRHRTGNYYHQCSFCPRLPDELIITAAGRTTNRARRGWFSCASRRGHVDCGWSHPLRTLFRHLTAADTPHGQHHYAARRPYRMHERVCPLWLGRPSHAHRAKGPHTGAVEGRWYG